MARYVGGLPLIIMTEKTIISRINFIDQQISNLSERLYRPDIKTSEQKEINKRKKKLDRDRKKLFKKLGSYENGHS